MRDAISSGFAQCVIGGARCAHSLLLDGRLLGGRVAGRVQELLDARKEQGTILLALLIGLRDELILRSKLLLRELLRFLLCGTTHGNSFRSIARLLLMLNSCWLNRSGERTKILRSRQPVHFVQGVPELHLLNGRGCNRASSRHRAANRGIRDDVRSAWRYAEEARRERRRARERASQRHRRAARRANVSIAGAAFLREDRRANKSRT